MLKLDNSMMKEVVLRERARKVSLSAPGVIGCIFFPFYLVYCLFLFILFPVLSIGVIKPSAKRVNVFMSIFCVVGFLFKILLRLIASLGILLFIVLITGILSIMIMEGVDIYQALYYMGPPIPVFIFIFYGLVLNAILIIKNIKITSKKIPVYDGVVKEVKKEKGKKEQKQFIKKAYILAKSKTPTQFYKALDNEYKPYLEKAFANEIAYIESVLSQEKEQKEKMQKLNEFGVNVDKFYKVFYGSKLKYIFTLIKALLFSKDTMPIFKETSRQVYISKGKKAQIKFILNAYKNSKKGNLEEVYTLLKDEKEYYKTIEDIAWTTEQFEERSRVILLGYALFDKMTAYKDAKKRVNNLYKVRDYKSLNELYAKYQPQVEEYKNNIIKTEGPKAFALEYDGKGTFDGYLIQKIGLSILCGLVNVVTLFIAYPATICWKQKWLCKHTIYDGKRLSFDGTGMQLFGKWLVWLLLSVVTFGIFLIFLPNKVEAWKAKHTHVNGEIQSLGGTFDGSVIGRFCLKMLCGIVNLFTLFICLPFTICWKQKWISKHTVYDGKRLSFNGNGLQLIGKWVIWCLLTVITFGIYGLFVSIRMEKWKASHIHLSKDYECVL